MSPGFSWSLDTEQTEPEISGRVRMELERSRSALLYSVYRSRSDHLDVHPHHYNLILNQFQVLIIFCCQWNIRKQKCGGVTLRFMEEKFYFTSRVTWFLWDLIYLARYQSIEYAVILKTTAGKLTQPLLLTMRFLYPCTCVSCKTQYLSSRMNSSSLR